MSTRDGPLWHMSVNQLKQFLLCNSKNLNDVQGTDKRLGKRGGMVTKRDLINAIRRDVYEGGAEPKKTRKSSPKGSPGKLQTGIKPSTDTVYEADSRKQMAVVKYTENTAGESQQTSDELQYTPATSKGNGQYGGGVDVSSESLIGRYMGFATAGPCISSNTFTPFSNGAVDIPHVNRLWHKVAGFDADINRKTIAVFRGQPKSTLVVQDLGFTDEFVDMWRTGMRDFRKKQPLMAYAKGHIRVEQPAIIREWVCDMSDKRKFGFTLIEGLWNVSLETLFAQIDQPNDYVLPAVLGPVLERMTIKQATEAGRDSLHYIWRFAKDTGGTEWLVLGILPLPYFFFEPGKGGGPINVDRMIRDAMY